jgi:hypothetical protein
MALKYHVNLFSNIQFVLEEAVDLSSDRLLMMMMMMMIIQFIFFEEVLYRLVLHMEGTGVCCDSHAFHSYTVWENLKVKASNTY